MPGLRCGKQENRNIGRRKRRDIARWNARLGRGRFGNLLRMVGVKLFQGRHRAPDYIGTPPA